MRTQLALALVLLCLAISPAPAGAEETPLEGFTGLPIGSIKGHCVVSEPGGGVSVDVDACLPS